MCGDSPGGCSDFTALAEATSKLWRRQADGDTERTFRNGEKTGGNGETAEPPNSDPWMLSTSPVSTKRARLSAVPHSC